MVTDISVLFGDNSADFFRRSLLKMMRNELVVNASAASTEQDKKIYNELTHNLSAEIEFGIGTIRAKAEIDITKLSNDFVSKNRGIIDLMNSNFDKKTSFFIESEINNMLDLIDVQQQIINQAQPEIIEELSNMFGGIS